MSEMELAKREAEYHSRVAGIYDQMHGLTKEDNHMGILYPVFRLLKSSLVLEVGCGTGRDGVLLVNNGYVVVETDISSLMVLKACANAKEVVKSFSNIHYIVADTNNLPFRPKQFDCVFIIASLHHVYNPQKGLREMARCLKMDGLLICGFEPNSWWFKTPFSIKLLKRLGSVIGGQRMQGSPGDMSTRGFSESELAHIFDLAGLEITRIERVWYSLAFVYMFRRIVSLLGLDLRLKQIEDLAIKVDRCLPNSPLKSLNWHWNVYGRKMIEF